jgi:hypothetical protein
MHGSRWRREETRPVGPARAARSRRLSPTLHKTAAAVLRRLPRAALEALPAQFEGIFRKHMIIEDVGVRDSAFYSVTDLEWPDVRINLEHRLLAARQHHNRAAAEDDRAHVGSRDRETITEAPP